MCVTRNSKGAAKKNECANEHGSKHHTHSSVVGRHVLIPVRCYQILNSIRPAQSSVQRVGKARPEPALRATKKKKGCDGGHGQPKFKMLPAGTGKGGKTR